MIRPPFRAAVVLIAIASTSLPAGAQGPPPPGVPQAPPTLPTPPAPPVPPTPPGPEAPAPPARPRSGPRVPLEVQIVLVREQNGKVISRLPYSLAVTTNTSEAVLNMGAEVPVPTTSFAPVRPAAPRSGTPGPAPPVGPAPTQGQPVPPQPAADAGAPPPAQSVSYRTVGTIISARAATADEGLYELVLSVDDTSVLPRDPSLSAATAPGLPAFRSFRARNTLLLRDGQTRTFSVAADRVSGEQVRVEVTLHTVK